MKLVHNSRVQRHGPSPASNHNWQADTSGKFYEDESITWGHNAEEKSQRLRELEEENDDLKSRKASADSAVIDPSRVSDG